MTGFWANDAQYAPRPNEEMVNTAVSSTELFFAVFSMSSW